MSKTSEKKDWMHFDGSIGPFYDESASYVNEVHDYMPAINEYRKTFPSKQDVIDKTPDPSVREMLIRMDKAGIENMFDRFDKQKPQCAFGMAGICCKICSLGPCKITAKSPRGTCGADANLIVARNLARSAAGAQAQHGEHAREVLIMLKWAALGKLPYPIRGVKVLNNVAAALEIKGHETMSVNEKAIAVADQLMDDCSRGWPGKYQVLYSFGAPGQIKIWEQMDLIPNSAYHECFETMNRTGFGIDGDWKSNMRQFYRNILCFLFTGVVTSNLATDMLFGPGNRRSVTANLGCVKEGFVNVAVHGHLPTLIHMVVEEGNKKEWQDKAIAAGAKGIRFYSVCCSGLAALTRLPNVYPLSNAVGAELAIATGAIDLWMVDIQDIPPGIIDVAKCFKVKVISTSDMSFFPGAEHIAYDRFLSNTEESEEIAVEILNKAIEAHVARKKANVPVYIPSMEVNAESGFTEMNVAEMVGFDNLAEAMKKGDVYGIVNIVGCSNLKTLYELPSVAIARKLIKNNVLITTNGCCAFPLLKMGYCGTDIYPQTGEKLRAFLEKYDRLPPALHVGECIDNKRSTMIMVNTAAAAGIVPKKGPFALCSPEWGNEKGLCAQVAFRVNGVSSFHCVPPPVEGAPAVKEALMNTKGSFGSTCTVDYDPEVVGDLILAFFKKQREALGWPA